MLSLPASQQDLLPVATGSRCDHAHFRFWGDNPSGFDVEYLQDPGTWNLQTW